MIGAIDMEKVNIHRVPMPPLINQKLAVKSTQSFEQSFSEHLNIAVRPEVLKISKHATDRLAERNIHISDVEWANVTEKVAEAKSKGIRDSLVLMEQAALIVSAKNSTVITAMDRKEAKNHLFTNIDGTIVLN